MDSAESQVEVFDNLDELFKMPRLEKLGGFILYCSPWDEYRYEADDACATWTMP